VWRPLPLQEELDAKLAAMEAEIGHGQLVLREEKQMIKDIAKLKAQRDRVREAEARKGAVRGWGWGQGHADCFCLREPPA
jgi:uncharacterized coiled-coil DUF342 family protein